MMNGSIRKSEPPESKYFRNSQCMSNMVTVEGCTSLFNVERCKDRVNQDDFMTCICCQHYDQYGFQRMKMNQIVCYENVWLSSPDEINLTMETILTQLVLGCWTNLGACWRAPFNVEEKSCSASSGCYINIEEAVWSKILFQIMMVCQVSFVRGGSILQSQSPLVHSVLGHTCFHTRGA